MLGHNKTIFFEIEKNVNSKTLSAYQDIFVESENNELFCKNGSGGYSIYLNETYICLDVDIETKRVGSFGGIFYAQKNKALVIPSEFYTGILKLKEEPQNFIKGTGTHMDFSREIFYDKNNKILQFGILKKNCEVYKVFKNLYVQLDKNGQLVSVVICLLH